MSSILEFTFKLAAKEFVVAVNHDDSTIGDLKREIERACQISVDRQKLIGLVKGKIVDDQTPLASLSLQTIPARNKIMVIDTGPGILHAAAAEPRLHTEESKPATKPVPTKTDGMMDTAEKESTEVERAQRSIEKLELYGKVSETTGTIDSTAQNTKELKLVDECLTQQLLRLDSSTLPRLERKERVELVLALLKRVDKLKEHFATQRQ
jgi:hypothetical protein